MLDGDSVAPAAAIDGARRKRLKCAGLLTVGAINCRAVRRGQLRPIRGINHRPKRRLPMPELRICTTVPIRLITMVPIAIQIALLLSLSDLAARALFSTALT